MILQSEEQLYHLQLGDQDKGAVFARWDAEGCVNWSHICHILADIKLCSVTVTDNDSLNASLPHIIIDPPSCLTAGNSYCWFDR